MMIAALVLAAAAAHPAHQTHQRGGQAAIRKSCAEELQKFCASVKPGGRRLFKCLKTNETSLSQACAEDLPMLHE